MVYFICFVLAVLAAMCKRRKSLSMVPYFGDGSLSRFPDAVRFNSSSVPMPVISATLCPSSFQWQALPSPSFNLGSAHFVLFGLFYRL